MGNAVYIRDTIRLTQPLLDVIAKPTAPGEHVILVAREMQMGGNVRLHDRKLTIMADIFDGRGGQITLDVPHQSNTPDANGGADGAKGREVVVYCRKVLGANILSRGGNGQPGAKGADGEDGSDFMPPPPIFHPGTPGKDGDNGFAGGAGGAGGPLFLFYVGAEQEVDLPVHNVPLTLVSQGGKGAAGGPGGKGGAGGTRNDAGTLFWPSGADGKPGRTGVDGANLEPLVGPIEVAHYWNQLRASLTANGALTQAAQHRLRMAEYFFRLYVPASSSNGLYGKLALGEADAVMNLAPAGSLEAVQALSLRDMLLNNLTPSGVPRAIEPRLSVPYYMQNYALVRGRTDVVVDRALLFGLTSLQAGRIQELVERHVDELENADTRAALEADLNEAITELKIATIGYEEAGKAVDQISEMVKARVEQLIGDGKPSFLDIAGEALPGVALTLGMGFLMGGPPGLLAALPAAANYVLASESFQQWAGSVLEDLPLEEIEQAAMTLNTVASLTGYQGIPSNAILSFKKFRADLESARNQGENDPVLIDLLQQQAAAVHQHYLAELGQTQANYAVEAATKRLDALDDNIVIWKQTLSNFQTDNASLRRYTVELVTRARGPFDVVLRLQYKMARALELYTLVPFAQSSQLTFNYGFAHPDVERDFLERSDNSSLLQEYLSEIATLTTLLPADQYSLLFTEYSEPSGGPHQWVAPNYDVTWTLTDADDADALALLRSKGRLDFSLPLAAVVGQEWFEAKVRGVELVFEGGSYAAAFNPTFQHWGKSVQRRQPALGGADVSQDLAPIFDSVPVEPVLGQSHLATGEIVGTALAPINSWGRGLAANYTLQIRNYGKPPVEGGPEINLEGLTKLTVRFKVDTFASGLSAVQINSLALAQGVLLPGSTVYGMLEMSAAAPAGGAKVTFTSSDAAVKVPFVQLAADERVVQFPIHIAPQAAGKNVTITAQTSATAHTLHLSIPNIQVRAVSLVTDEEQGEFHAPIGGLLADDHFLYATCYLAAKDGKTPSSQPGQLAVIDPETMQVKQRVTVGYEPVSIAVHANAQRRRIFVVNRGAQTGTLSVFDLAPNGASIKPVSTVQLAAGITDAVVHQASSRVFVSNWAGAMYVINAVATDPAGLLVETIPAPRGILGMSVDQSGNVVYVARTRMDATPPEEKIEIFNPAHKSFTPLSIPPGPFNSRPADVAFDPDGRLYVANLGAFDPNSPNNVPANVTVMQLNADDTVTVRTGAGPFHVAVDSERDQAYVATGSGLELIAATNHGGPGYGVLLRLPVGGPRSITVHPTLGEVYVGDLFDGTVRAIPALNANTIIEGL